MIVDYAINELHLVQQFDSNLANTSLGWHWLGWSHSVAQLFNRTRDIEEDLFSCPGLTPIAHGPVLDS